MSVSLRVEGARSFRDLAADCRREQAGSQRRIVEAMSRGARGLRQSIPAAAAGRLPSGYAPIMAASVRVTQTVSVAAGRVGIRIHAKGHRDARDVVAVDAGILRHPTFGRRGEGDWRVTDVRPGFASDPWAQSKDKIVGEVMDELGGMAARIARGG